MDFELSKQTVTSFPPQETRLSLSTAEQTAPVPGSTSTDAGDLAPPPEMPVADSSEKQLPEVPQEELTPPEAQLTVTDIQIRFVNKQGSPADENGRPIEGRTSKRFILGELKLQPGAAFSEELLEQDLRRLRRLRLFERASVSARREGAGVTLIYDLQEARARSLTPGAGNSGDVGLYGSLTYDDQNIGGLNQQVFARVQISGKDVQYRAGYTDPYRAGEPDRLGYSVGLFRQRDFSRTFTDEIELANGDSVREGRFGGGAALLRSFDGWDGSLGLNYTRISMRDSDWDVVRKDAQGNPLSISGDGIDDLVTVSLGVTRDLRNRRSNPTDGSVLTLSAEQSVPVGLGNIFAHRLRANYTQYVPVGQRGAGEPSGSTALAEVLAFNLQAGTVLGDLPPSEAFNLGGLNSVRGYGAGKVGSGRSYVLGSVEYRFPIAAPVGGVLFADFASDLGSGDTVLGTPAAVRDKPGTGFGYGIGLRVLSPLGLIRGDLGISDGGEIRFELTTGQRF